MTRFSALSPAETAETALARLRAEQDALVGAVIEEAAKRCEADVPEWATRGPGTDFAAMVRALRPDATAALSRMLAEARNAERNALLDRLRAVQRTTGPIAPDDEYGKGAAWAMESAIAAMKGKTP